MAEKARPEVFVRKATGLVREIGLLTGIICIMGHVVGLGWQKRVFQCIGWLPVPETTYLGGWMPPLLIAFLVVWIIVMLNAYCWAVMGSAMPRAGGGYVYTSRVLGPIWGFLAGWGSWLMAVILWGVVAAAGMECLAMFGAMAGLKVVANPQTIFGFGLVVIWIISIIAILGTRALITALHIIFWIPVIVTIIMYGIFISVTPEAMALGVQRLFGVSAETITRAALEHGMREYAKYSFWDGVAAASIGAYWAYVGYTATAFVAGEVKEAYKKLPWILLLANTFINLLYLTLPPLAARACMMVGRVENWSFLSAWSYLSHGAGKPYFSSEYIPGLNPTAPKGWLPCAAAIAAEGMGLVWLKYLFVLFGILWPINDVPPALLASTRILFAMSFDRVLPEWLAAVSKRFYSPVNAILFCAVFTTIFGAAAEAEIFGPGWLNIPWLHLWINSGTGVSQLDLWDLMCYFFTSLAAIMFPYKRRDIYEKAPFRMEIGGVPLITILGVGAFLGNCWLIWVILSSPASALRLVKPDLGSIVSLSVTVAFIIAGLIIYAYYRYYKGRVLGVDYTTVYAQIPPE